MTNCNTCIIGITMLISSIYMSILKQDQDIFLRFLNLLNEDQQQIYSMSVSDPNDIPKDKFLALLKKSLIS